MNQQLNRAFERELYRLTVQDVKAHFPKIRLNEAWVYPLDRRNNHWEFHYRGFYWHGTATGAFEARAEGWSDYLTRIGVPGYADERNEE